MSVAPARIFANTVPPGGLRAPSRLLLLCLLILSVRQGLAQSAPQVPRWEPLGPAAVVSANYGLVTGRVSALALDPYDPTGNRLYVGTTGGGVWLSQNAAASNPSDVRFSPLTDQVGALIDIPGGSITIGALTVQPGGTGVILAGTGDPNNAQDSYYGAGVLRSADGGNTWTLIQSTPNQLRAYGFLGEAFAGFAWSTVDTQLVVAAVSRSTEGLLVLAEQASFSDTGLYYSTDAGLTWQLAVLTDPGGGDVQGPLDYFVAPDGTPATSVVWNPVRQRFLAAVSLHGYYQSKDGVTWTRLASQPGRGLAFANCPTSVAAASNCPIARGTLAVNPLTGDTFAWTVDLNNQDQGLWQDVCASACADAPITFAKQWSTTALQSNTESGPATIPDGAYNLALAALPSGSGANPDTILFAGTDDLWRCSLAAGCAWRNTTHASTCASAQVGSHQHALEWNTANALQLFIGNDSGLWRSTDAVSQTGSECSPGDSSHFQNLNGGLGSLAEVTSLSPVGASLSTLIAGLGANGTAAVAGGSGPTTDWPQILAGPGGPIAAAPGDSSTWYANNAPGISIFLCSQSGPASPVRCGASPLLSSSDVSGDGRAMSLPAPFLVDPVDPARLLIGTCRLWRGPASGLGWTSANAVSPILDRSAASSCNGDVLIRSMAALALPAGGEVVYVGTYGLQSGGKTLPGHVLGTTMDASGAWSLWSDLNLGHVVNDSLALNSYRLDISSLFVDPHDATGKTVYVTVAGIPNSTQNIRLLYRSTDGGATWTVITSNLPFAPANSLVIDPVDANTVYVATDLGVFSTHEVADCGNTSSDCWAPYGTGLPESPVVALSASPPSRSLSVLVAATYGRGLWQIPLWTAGDQFTAAADALAPLSLSFPATEIGAISASQSLTLANGSGKPLTSISISTAGPFQAASNCTTQLAANSSCSIDVRFEPSSAGSSSGTLVVSDILRSQTVQLSGSGVLPTAFLVAPSSLSFMVPALGQASAPQTVSLTNATSVQATGIAMAISGEFRFARNACAPTLAPGESCVAAVEFVPTTAGMESGSLVIASSLMAPRTIPLSGSEFDFAVTFSGASMQTVASGQTARFTLSIVPSSVAPAAFAFQCGSLPANAACVFNPVTNEIAAGATGTEIVEVTTGQASASVRRPPAVSSGLRILLAFCWLALPALIRRRGHALRCATLLALLIAVSGCTSSGGGQGGDSPNSLAAGSTPPNTYSVSVQVTSNGVQHGVNLSLTVD